MPLYEYQCETCQKVTERIQKFSDPPLDACPACGGAVRKLLSSPAIQFKGSGWYITDYARKSGNGSGGASKGEGSETSGKDASDKDKKDTAAVSGKSESKSDSSPAKSEG